MAYLQSYEAWLEKYEETLEPLREFFRLHDIDSEWAIAELYKNGYWGKKVMRTLPPKRHGIQSSTSEDGTAETGYPWEVAIDVWSDAFLAENLPHAPLDIVRRWPSLLCKTPDCLPGTVAVLRAAIPDEESLNETISMFPRILVQSPVKLQHRLLALQMACGMDLSSILPRNPHLFYRHLDSVMSNIRCVCIFLPFFQFISSIMYSQTKINSLILICRHLREYSWSLEHFCNLISYRPNLLTMHPDVVKRNTESSLEAVQMVLPDGADAKLVIKAKPQLILIPPSHINERWEKILSLTGEIAEWKQELQSALDDIVDGSQQLALEANKENGEASMQNLPNHPGDSEFGAGKDNVISASQEENMAEQDGDTNEPSWEPGEWGSTTIGSAVWTHPKRHQRLEFLIEVVGKNAGDVSFVDALTVHYHRFNHRYPQFDDWVQRQFNSEFRNG